MDLDKARLLTVRRTWNFRWRPMYVRVANAAALYALGLEIVWRMPWLKTAIWSKAWDDGFRHGMESGYQMRVSGSGTTQDKRN